MIRTHFGKILRVACAAVLILLIWTACAPTGYPTTAPDATSAPQQPIKQPPTSKPENPKAAPEKPMAPDSPKPPLAFSKPMKGAEKQIIAYTLPADSPEWTIPMRAAPIDDIRSNPYGGPENYDGRTPIGVVEIGTSAVPAVNIASGIYLVAVNLSVDKSDAPGLLIPESPDTSKTLKDFIPDTDKSKAKEVSFEGKLQRPNDNERNGKQYFQKIDLLPNSVAINADGVCFVVNPPDQEGVFIRYCSKPGSVLSVILNFPDQYSSLKMTMTGVADRFGLVNDIQNDQIISEMEHPERLKNCEPKMRSENAQAVVKEACSSDIIVAPVTSDFYNKSKANAKKSSLPGSHVQSAFMLGALFQPENAYSVTVAAVRISQPIQTSLGPVEPGDYQMDYWFDSQDVFYAATITGFKQDQSPVTNQQVPTVPATFVNQDDSEQPGAQISTCRIFGKCVFWQSTCP